VHIANVNENIWALTLVKLQGYRDIEQKNVTDKEANHIQWQTAVESFQLYTTGKRIKCWYWKGSQGRYIYVNGRYVDGLFRCGEVALANELHKDIFKSGLDPSKNASTGQQRTGSLQKQVKGIEWFTGSRE